MRDMYDDIETLSYNNNANVDDISDAKTINYANKNPPKQQKSIEQIKTKKKKRKKHENLKRKTASNKQKNAKKRRIWEDDVVL